MPKTKINISLDQDLADFAKIFAAENRITVADIMTQYLLTLKRKVESQNSETILSHPKFQSAMEESQNKLRNGSANWHSYDEVFGD
ncbi:MAG: hypothetical protein HOD92_08810 [Deltaproteobacteria bacterium]|jgi:hypothetical protein|nr:hypothetical protein [Deltaproteobacteria bacterium]MBT4525939.1 hypothetical protein [Deltaproteobacteria bacterium]